MRGRSLRTGALGAVGGIALAVALAVSPASAAKPGNGGGGGGGGGGTIVASATCASFEGLTVTTATPSYTGVSLRSGEAITARVTPAAPGDEIYLSASLGLSLYFASGPAEQGYTYRAGADGVYSLGWWVRTASGATASGVTWTFDCSSVTGGTTPPPPTTTTPPPTTTADDDRDGVVNSADACKGTVLPDSISKPAAGSYYANSSGAFVDGTGRAAGITVVDTGGCSATQIASALKLKGKDAKSGIALSALTSWANTH